MDSYFFILTTIDLFVLGFMCLLTRLSESLNKKQKRGFLLAFALIACISVLEVITIVVDGAPLGYRWRIVRAIVTNFHQPKSTLLLLVSAFVGDGWRRIYDYALGHGFRFLSYGDSSVLLRE